MQIWTWSPCGLKWCTLLLRPAVWDGSLWNIDDRYMACGHFSSLKQTGGLSRHFVPSAVFLPQCWTSSSQSYFSCYCWQEFQNILLMAISRFQKLSHQREMVLDLNFGDTKHWGFTEEPWTGPGILKSRRALSVMKYGISSSSCPYSAWCCHLLLSLKGFWGLVSKRQAWIRVKWGRVARSREGSSKMCYWDLSADFMLK